MAAIDMMWFGVILLFLFPIPVGSSQTRDNIITRYFHCGFSYPLIICFLYFVHGISLSLRQLKRILRRLKLRRRQSNTRSFLHQVVRSMMVCY